MDIIYRVLGEEEYLKNLCYVGLYLMQQCNLIQSFISACSSKYCLCHSLKRPVHNFTESQEDQYI